MWVDLAPAIVLLLLLIVGLILLRRGLRGRFVGCPPTCGQCGYNLTGLTSERCPECGSLVAKARVLRRRRERRYGLVVGGVVALFPLVVLLALYVAGVVRSLDVYGFMPTSWMLSDIQSSDSLRAAKAYRHLERKLRAGELNAAQIKRLAELAFADSALESPRKRMASQAGRLLGTRRRINEAARQHLGKLVEVKIEALSTCRFATGIPVDLTVRFDELPSGVVADPPFVQIVPPGTSTDAAARDSPRTTRFLYKGRSVPDKSLAERPYQALIYYTGKACTGDASWNVTVGNPGPKEINLLVTIDLLSRRTGVPSPYTPFCRLAWTFTVKSNVVAYPPASTRRTHPSPPG